MSKEAMKLALDALDEFCELGAIIRQLEVRDALREALADEAIEPAPVQQEPEHMVSSNSRYSPLLTHMMNTRVKSNLKQVIELYDSPDQPAQRTWVGLTGEEVINVIPDDDTPMSLGEAFSKFAELIEAKLKEKNT